MKRLSKMVFFFIVTLPLIPINSFAQTQSRGELRRQIETKRAELQLLEKQFLEPAEKDRKAYAEFLTQPDTGLIRLLPRETFDSEVYRKINKSLTIRGGGAYYSFLRLTHEYGYGSDLELEMDHFVVGFAGADYGLMVNLGDVSLDELTVEDPRARYLAVYAPPREEESARLEARQYAAGLMVDGRLYKNRLAVELGSTYLLRSIGYARSDVLVAFRVVRKDTDGSVTLTWKLLKTYLRPQGTQITS